MGPVAGDGSPPLLLVSSAVSARLFCHWPLPTGPILRFMPVLPVVVSGVQPSGTLHLGNYFGALRQHVALARDASRRAEAFVFLADYHALTTVRDPEALRRSAHDVALDYLALGFDAPGAHLFAQSRVPTTSAA